MAQTEKAMSYTGYNTQKNNDLFNNKQQTKTNKQTIYLDHTSHNITNTSGGKRNFTKRRRQHVKQRS
jgi:hypothetical protein